MSYMLLRPLLFAMDPEHTHELTLKLLDGVHRSHLLGFFGSSQALPTSCMRMTLPNPVGLAAGLDKNGMYIDALAELGFGFIEVGTVTPRPQNGNPKPRLFRLKDAGGIINRMGFNNAGVAQLIRNIKKTKYQGVLGINIGKNASTPVEDALSDYLYCMERVYPYASYITINISSPNTKNLRDLQSNAALENLLHGLKNRHAKLANHYGFYVPLALKIAPDLNDAQIDDIARQLIDFEIDGLIATNTSLSRTGVENYPESQESGGLSGKPISHISTHVLSQFSRRLNGKVDLIGVGGIDSADTAIGKIQAGASAIQLYSGLVYHGSELIIKSIQAIANYQDAQINL